MLKGTILSAFFDKFDMFFLITTRIYTRKDIANKVIEFTSVQLDIRNLLPNIVINQDWDMAIKFPQNKTYHYNTTYERISTKHQKI